MLRCFLVIVLLGTVPSCTKKVDLPQIMVDATDSSEFARFRSELGGQFPMEQLKDFDIAVQELKLDAMNRDIASSEAREADAFALINGKTVYAATLLGWQARHARFLREIAEISPVLERDLKARQNAGPNGPSSVVLARIQSAQNVIAQIQANDTAAERRLTELRATGEK